jgi:hypothetical protein
MDASGVKVSEISVGRDKLSFVGGRVDVTKGTAVGAAVFFETVMQELRLKVTRRINVQIFFMAEILIGKH